MSVSEIASMVSSAAAALALLISIWAKLTARANADIREIREQQDKLHVEQDDEKRRLARIEATLEQMPKAESVHELRVDVARIEGQLGVIGERLKPVAQVTERLQDWLLENKK